MRRSCGSRLGPSARPALERASVRAGRSSAADSRQLGRRDAARQRRGHRGSGAAEVAHAPVAGKCTAMQDRACRVRRPRRTGSPAPPQGTRYFPSAANLEIQIDANAETRLRRSSRPQRGQCNKRRTGQDATTQIRRARRSGSDDEEERKFIFASFLGTVVAWMTSPVRHAAVISVAVFSALDPARQVSDPCGRSPPVT